MKEAKDLKQTNNRLELNIFEKDEMNHNLENDLILKQKYLDLIPLMFLILNIVFLVAFGRPDNYGFSDAYCLVSENIGYTFKRVNFFMHSFVVEYLFHRLLHLLRLN